MLAHRKILLGVTGSIAAYKAAALTRRLVEAGADMNVWNQPNAKEWSPLNIVEGVHRGMNIQSNPATAKAIRQLMKRAGVSPPAGQ